MQGRAAEAVCKKGIIAADDLPAALGILGHALF